MPSGVSTGLPGDADTLGQLPFGKNKILGSSQQKTQDWTGSYARNRQAGSTSKDESATGIQSQLPLYLAYSFLLACVAADITHLTGVR